jgi:esterase/lipase superfamily enzyme
MNREYHRWYSPALGRDMELLLFGHAGARMLVFPTSKGRFFEWEDRRMMDTLGDYIDAGHLQVMCVDSVDAESWYAWQKSPGERAYRQVQYENYLVYEALPLMYGKNPNPFLVVTGASFGAYHAMNFALRHPDITNRVLAMSGMFNIERWLGGYRDDNVYYNCPCLYLPNETNPGRLEQLRRLDIVIAVGQNDPNIANNRWFSEVLWGKSIWHALRLWDGWSHDWPYWQQMIRLYIGGAD